MFSGATVKTGNKTAISLKE